MSREELSSQERVRIAISRNVPDRVPIQDGPWRATVSRWRKEGLPENQEPGDYFGFDLALFGADLTPRFPVRVIDENEEYITESTPYGGIRRNHRDYSTTPDVVDCPVKSKDDWTGIKERLKFDFKRVDWATSWERYQRAREDGKYVVFGAVSGYDLAQSYISSELLLSFMADDPEWIKEIIDTCSDLVIEAAGMMRKEGFLFDGLWVYNDMGYRNSSLFSPKMYEEIIGPSDRKRNAWAHENGMQTILHSCGRVKGLIPALIEHGFDCLQPLEVKAGMDLGELKRDYGDRIALFGGINVMLMEDPDDSKIENEIREKFKVAMPGGGYLFHSDHSIPLDVSFRKYQFVMDCVKRYGAY